jgi:hypothetical protein
MQCRSATSSTTVDLKLPQELVRHGGRGLTRLRGRSHHGRDPAEPFAAVLRGYHLPCREQKLAPKQEYYVVGSQTQEGDLGMPDPIRNAPSTSGGRL